MRIIITTLILFLSFQIQISSQPKREIRATWLTTLGGLDWPHNKAYSPSTVNSQKEELCTILDSLKNANFNTIILQTRVRGDLIYPSSIETFTESISGQEGKSPGYDPLEFAINECHKRGMQLHAWIVTIPIGNIKQIKTLGRNSVVYKKKKLCKFYNGSWYLDPGNPETKNYLSAITNEIVKNYDVDGIHLDYIRYPDNPIKFNDKDTYKKYGKGKSLSQWRRENITSIVKKIYDETKKLKPWVIVSSSPIGKYNNTTRYSSNGWNAYSVVYQDAQKWLKDGIHDAIFPMMYFRDNNFYPFALDWIENCNNRWVIPGLGIYFLSPRSKDWPLSEISRQIYFIRKYKLNGQAYFRTQFILENQKNILNELKKKTYLYPALIPPMTWIDSIAPSVPSEPNISIDKNIITIKWKESIDNSSLPPRYNIYGSDSYPVDVNQICNLISSYNDSLQYKLPLSSVRNKYIYFAVTAIDRYGNESEPLFVNGNEKNNIKILNKGGILSLTKSNQYSKIIISTITDNIIYEGSFKEKIKISSLRKGIYIVKGINDSGQIKNIGIIHL